MPSFDEHLAQAKHNLDFLSQCSIKIPSVWDWQVTIAFYIGVHLVNAHITRYGHQYRTHSDVERFINPFQQIILPSKLPNNIFISYKALSNLARISRYLYNPDTGGTSHAKAKSVRKALTYLDSIMQYFNNTYSCGFENYAVGLNDLPTLTHFHIAPKQ